MLQAVASSVRGRLSGARAAGRSPSSRAARPSEGQRKQPTCELSNARGMDGRLSPPPPLSGVAAANAAAGLAPPSHSQAAGFVAVYKHATTRRCPLPGLPFWVCCRRQRRRCCGSLGATSNHRLGAAPAPVLRVCSRGQAAAQPIACPPCRRCCRCALRRCYLPPCKPALVTQIPRTQRAGVPSVPHAASRGWL